MAIPPYRLEGCALTPMYFQGRSLGYVAGGIVTAGNLTRYVGSSNHDNAMGHFLSLSLHIPFCHHVHSANQPVMPSNMKTKTRLRQERDDADGHNTSPTPPPESDEASVRTITPTKNDKRRTSV